MLTADGRSEAAKKANETRKRNRYEAMCDEAMCDEAIQSARRQHLYSTLNDEQRDAIDTQIDSTTSSTSSFAPSPK